MFSLLLFSFQCSFEHKYGHVRYELKAQYPGKWFSSLIKSSPYTIPLKLHELIDLNLPKNNFPVSGMDSKTCWFGSGPLTINAKIDRSAYSPSDTMTITATFSNNSKQVVKPYVKMKQVKYFRAKGKEKSTIKCFDLKLLDSNSKVDEEVKEGDSLIWEAKLFKVPRCRPSIDCRIIEVLNSIEIGLAIPFSFDLKINLPIRIGNASPQSTGPQQTTIFSKISNNLW